MIFDFKKEIDDIGDKQLKDCSRFEIEKYLYNKFGVSTICAGELPYNGEI